MLASLTNANRARASRLAALGACAAAALVCLWLLVRLAWLLVPQGDVASPSVPVASTPAAVPVQSVGKWHLFGNPQTIAVLQQMRNAPATTLKLTLRGTLATDDAHDGIAMIEDEHGGERAYKVGEVVGSNAKLVAVYADHVVLDHEGVAETLNLPRAEQHAPPLPPANQANPATATGVRSSSIPPNYAPPQLSGNLDWSAAQSKLRVDPAQLAKQVHVEPVFENCKFEEPSAALSWLTTELIPPEKSMPSTLSFGSMVALSCNGRTVGSSTRTMES